MKCLQLLVCGWLFTLACAGCGLHYFDPSTGTEHVWGFGHVKMRLAPSEEGLQAIARGTDVLGFSLGHADQQVYLTLGWHRVQRLDVVQESTAVRLEWPDADFVNVRVGSKFPFATAESASTSPARGGEEDQ